MTGPGDIDDERDSERITLEIRASDYDFLTRLAAYRNLLAKAQGKKLRKQWSRKQLGESFIAAQVDAMRHQLAEMFEAVGELPEWHQDDLKSRKAMEDYVRRVLEWDAKHSK